MSQAEPQPHPARGIVIGSSGGIGSAMVRGLTARGFAVTSLSRSGYAGDDGDTLDLTRESTIEAATRRLREKAPFAAIIVSTGLLHDPGVAPEKSLRELDQASLMRLFAVNTVGPALVAKHFVPLLPRQGRCVFAVLSARVGSIGDNRLGGWYGYRASKAALNMIIKTLAIELSRSRPEAICVGLHPGTVDTGLSKPFQKGVPAGRLFSAEQSASHLLDVIGELTPSQTGRCLAWDGTEIVP